MTSALLDFYPLVMESIRIQPEPQRKAHEEAKERGEIFVGVAAGIHNREMYTELIKAQVKVSSVSAIHLEADGQTMAFLAYVLRGSTNNEIKHYLDIFPEACIRLLKDCPPEDVATRKVS
jgi:transformation/transcription domain-associated protein